MENRLFKLDEVGEKICLLKMIKKSGRITRGQIIDDTGYSGAKIGILIKELQEKGLVAEVGEDDSTGGRKAKILQLKENIGYLVGVELGGYELKIVLSDFNGEILSSKKLLEDPNETNPERVMDKLISFIKDFMADNSAYKNSIKAIGVALSGIVDEETGGCRYFRNQKVWEGVPIQSTISQTFSLPCYIEDSSRAMAIAERAYGSCRDVESFILFSIGVGLGTGIYINGSLFRGSRGVGGEIGHMVIKENGPRCVCGNYGCLESLVSGYAIERQIREALQDNVYSNLSISGSVSAKRVVEEAKAGDKLAYGIINEAAKHLGVGIASAINIFNPQAIILAGGVSQAGDLLLEPIRQVVKSSALEISARGCDVLISPLNEYSASLGMTSLCIDRLLDDPKEGAALLNTGANITSGINF